jgi:hypothetical protein
MLLLVVSRMSSGQIPRNLHGQIKDTYGQYLTGKAEHYETIGFQFDSLDVARLTAQNVVNSKGAACAALQNVNNAIRPMRLQGLTCQSAISEWRWN